MQLERCTVESIALVVCSGLIGCHGVKGPAASGGGDARRPNIVVFVADDMGWNDIGYHGSEVQTPNLDRLAASGVELDRFYVYPTCSPTRAAFLTGRCPSRYNILGPIGGRSTHALPKETATLASQLRGLGYRTGIMGKWHLGLRPEVGPRQYGFYDTYGYFHGQVDPYTHLYKNGDRTWHRNDQYVDEEGHVTDLITAEALRFIERHRDLPFFLYVPYSVPHYPLDEPERFRKPYEGKIKNASRLQFAASCTHMDESIGRIVAKLDQLDLREDTLVVFFSDNGGQKSWSSKTQYDGRYPPNDVLGDNRPLRGWKGQLYEGGIRVPALANWKGRLRRGKVNHAIGVVDLLPTLMRVVGSEAAISDDAPLDGVDVWPAITGSGVPAKRVLYWKTGGQYAVRRGDYKLIRGKGDKPKTELFNVTADPYEKMDLTEAEPERVKVMLAELDRQRKADSK